MKSLGQIAYRAYEDAYGQHKSGKGPERWEAAAQAVRQAVLEEAAKACEDAGIDYVLDEDYAAHVRNLKGKQ